LDIKVGDSIVNKRVGLIGIVTDKRYVKVLDDTMYTIAWMDGEMSNERHKAVSNFREVYLDFLAK
jgi:hypothetical protein